LALDSTPDRRPASSVPLRTGTGAHLSASCSASAAARDDREAVGQFGERDIVYDIGADHAVGPVRQVARGASFGIDGHAVAQVERGARTGPTPHALADRVDAGRSTPLAPLLRARRWQGREARPLAGRRRRAAGTGLRMELVRTLGESSGEVPRRDAGVEQLPDRL
jgi:hypothetical protein